MQPSRRGDSIAGWLARRLAGDQARVTSCAVCGKRMIVDRHCIRRDDAYLHAHCALYRNRRAHAA